MTEQNKVKYNQALLDVLYILESNEGIDKEDLSTILVNYMIKNKVISLDSYSWEEISHLAKKGLAPFYFNIGDQKSIKINGIDYTAIILDFDTEAADLGYKLTDDDKPDEKTIDGNIAFNDDLSINYQITGITFGILELTQGNFQLHCKNTNKVPYYNTTMDSILNDYVLSNLEEDLLDVIVPVYRFSLDDIGMKYKLFALTEMEVTGKNVLSLVNRRDTFYDYFKENPEKRVKKQEGTNIKDSYWLASPYMRDDKSWIFIDRDGLAGYDYAENRRSITFAFCI